MAKLLKGDRKPLDGFEVTRVLPNFDKKMVGPFIFFDHMGPATFTAGNGIDVRPHPHIGLATITYMFEGSLLHRDSLGNNLEIIPGDVNWMTAGKGITHSERETLEVKAAKHTLDGLQTWVALPKDKAEIEPSFTHVKKSQLPHFMKEGVLMRLIAGEACGKTAPIKTYSPMFYMDVLAPQGKTIARPNPEQECAVYVLQGEVSIGDQAFAAGQFVLLEQEQSIVTLSQTRFVLIGGEQWQETPHMFWNFVSFDKDRLEQAKQDWKEGRFPAIPGDEDEFTPLPEKPKAIRA
ncbi:MAG: redox-sensitive bicupin YhaK (pirin superfamily) [Bermanella sp.]|jgi:redox-sensitive bicupin YhaK (pirin superfamily)